MLIIYTEKAVLPSEALVAAIGIDPSSALVSETRRTVAVDLLEIKPAANAGRMDEAFVIDALDAYMLQRGFERTDPAPKPRPASEPSKAPAEELEPVPEKRGAYVRTIMQAAEVLKG